MRSLRKSVHACLALSAAIFVSTAPPASAADLWTKAPTLNIAPAWVPMFGDLIGIRQPRNALSHTAYKITENESPRPLDRIFVTFNYFDNVRGGTLANERFDVARSVIGFEKTFLDGNASFGIRLPIVQQTETPSSVGVGGPSGPGVGDIAAIFKYAFVNDRQTGNVLSAGVAVSVPTGTQVAAFDTFPDRPIQSVILQPFIGGVFHVNRDFFFQGFSSLAVPTDSRDVTVWHNSVSAHYWLYRGPPGQFVTGIIPVVEIHFNTPVNQRSDVDPRVENNINITAGFHTQFYNNTLFGLAISKPISGPKLYDIEIITSLNLRY